MPIQDQAPDYVRAIAPYQGGLPIAEIARRYGFSESQVVKLASNEVPRHGPDGACRHGGCQPGSRSLSRWQWPRPQKSLVSTLRPARRLAHDWQWRLNDILELMAHAFLRPGRSSVFSTHSFAVYALVTQATGATAVVVPAVPRTWDTISSQFLLHLSPSTAVVWVANPDNPWQLLARR